MRLEQGKAHLVLTDSLQFCVSRGVKCQLAARSEAALHDPKRLRDWWLSSYSSDLGKCFLHGAKPLYNMMWIGLDGDVTHCKALGIVGKDDFDVSESKVTAFKLY